jgi:predicted nucleotidyltransferase
MGRKTKDFEALPKSIQNLIDQSLAIVAPEKIALFGSRARRSHRPDSDFDLAFWLPANCQKNWTRFLVLAEESPWTLQKVDLVDYNSLSEEYKTEISKEAILIYE